MTNPDIRTVSTDLAPLHVVSTGTGSEPIVLWPSIFTDHRIYDGLVPQLAARFRLHLIDGPGHGGSGGMAREVTMAGYARALGQVMDALDLQRATVGGTSWGGMVAAELAMRSPARVAHLVLMTTPLRIDGRRPGMKARAIALGARHALGLPVFRNGIARSFFMDALAGKPDYRNHFHTMLRDANRPVLAAHVRSVILRGTPLIDRLDRIAAPTLVIAGRDDPMYPLADQAEAARRLRDRRLVEVPGGHISPVEAPDTVAAAILDVLRADLAA